jgi:hypothetical protein
MQQQPNRQSQRTCEMSNKGIDGYQEIERAKRSNEAAYSRGANVYGGNAAYLCTSWPVLK